RHVEDVNTDGEDHIYDELRYMCMMNPITPKPSAKEKIPDFDPLNMYQDKVSYDRYDFFRKM
ncbi:MAG: Terminase-like family protein, partial [Oscillospiraceae bacterium]|nr:Terminase-like family protein [Oscillospiraceae bacterium]